MLWTLIKGAAGLFAKSDSDIAGRAMGLVEMGARGIDAMKFTDEEKAVNALEIGKQKLEWGKLAMDHVKTSQGESTQRSLSRRYLAWGVFALGGFLTLYALAARSVAVFWENKADKLIELAKFALELLGLWWPIIFAAGVFYFGAHLLRSTKGTDK